MCQQNVGIVDVLRETLFTLFRLKDNCKFFEHCYGHQQLLGVPPRKIVCIWSFSSPNFSAVGLNTEKQGPKKL